MINNKKIYFIAIIIFSTIFISACDKPLNQKVDISDGDIQQIGTLDIEEFENKKNTNEYVLIDIRDLEELMVYGYIPGSINIVFYSNDFLHKINELPKNKKYLIYCNSGNRTLQTLQMMKKLGFKEVFHLEGGIQSWMSKQKQLSYCSNQAILGDNIC